MSTLEEPITQLRRPSRFVAFAVLVGLVIAGLTTRLFFLQLSDKPGAAAPAAAAAIVPTKSTTTNPLPAIRGLIYDRAHRPLVENVVTYSVTIRQSELPLSRRDAVTRRLSQVLGITDTEIKVALDSSPASRFDPVVIAENVPEKVVNAIREDGLTLPGVGVEVVPRRHYLTKSLFTQIVGWTGAIDAVTYDAKKASGYLADDRIGKAGVESTYEEQLRGIYGSQEVEKDGTGATTRVVSTTAAVAGNSLILTIDSKEQQMAQKALEWGLKKSGNKRGAFVVLNPQTGEVLAMVSLPTYDGNAFVNGITNASFQKLLTNKHKPLINHAISEIHPPGSTFKLVTGIGVLADGKLGKTEKVRSKPYVELGGIKYWEWNRAGWGALDIKGAFGHSSDTFFYQMAHRLGTARLAYWANQLGFGQKSGIDLPAEAAGLIPTDTWKLKTYGQRVFAGETLQAGIGQGYDLSTPLQVANAYATLANGGKVMQPQVVREIVDSSGKVVRSFKPKVIRKVKAPSWVFTTMRQAARNVVTSRHTYNLVDMPIVVAGKTGTAEFGVRDKNGVLPYHHWFAGFVPKNAWKKDNPTGDVSKPDSQLAFAVFVYDSGTLGDSATEIAKYWLQLRYKIKHDYTLPELLKRTNFYQGGR